MQERDDAGTLFAIIGRSGMSILSTIEKVPTTDPSEALNTAREIIQEAILSGIYRSNFFGHAAFQGGTSLRIFHGLDRFSEDLDFCVVDEGYEVDFDRLSDFIRNELESLGLDYKLDRIKGSDGNITGCFIEGNAVETLSLMGYQEKLLKQVHPNTLLKVKIGIDKEIPGGYGLEHVFKEYPFNYGATLLDFPSLFAGKTSAVITRHWRNRIKGRDLYDFEWYIDREVPVNTRFLENNLMREGLVGEYELDRQTLLSILERRFNSINYDSALSDLRAFVPPSRVPTDWNPDHFIELSKRIVMK